MKNSNGGDLSHDIFDKILSIGYELESLSLSKLSLLDGNILMNTDTVSIDIPNINANDDFGALRQYEKIEFDVYKNSTNEVDPDSKFYALNDITNSKFVKNLTALCEEEMTNAVLANNDPSKEDAIYKNYKNELYTFIQNGSDIPYKINFETRIEKDCGTFADVEWVFTYYKPKRGKNIILDTFTNVIKNLHWHLSQLEPIRGNLLVNNSTVVTKPSDRILYHYPNTNMYYLQIHHLDEQQTINDICIVPQMTFSCQIENIIPITKELLRDSLKTFGDDVVLTTFFGIVEKIENCVNTLLENYNKTAGEKRAFVGYRANIVKNYIFLILFKLYRYYNNYLTDETVIRNDENKKYLKDKLFINSRHSNAELYKYLKIAVATTFNITDSRAVDIIRKLILQQSVLEHYMDEGHKTIRKGAFKNNNILEKTNSRYGNPAYSLYSYFQFFENPIAEVDTNDWLYYSGIDVYSSNMKIKNNVVLVELRTFKHILNNCIGSFADAALTRELSNGACNRIRNRFKPNIDAFTVNALHQFANLYDSNIIVKKTQKSRTRKTPRTRKSRTLKTRKSKSKSKSS